MKRKITSDSEQKLKKMAEKQKRADKQIKILWRLLEFTESKAFKVIILCSVIVIVAIVFKDKKIESNALYAGYINWDSLKVPEEELDVEGVEVVEGTIGFDRYLQLRKDNTYTELTDRKELMSDAMYKNLIQGIDSKYFYDSIQADYNVLCTGVQGLIGQSQWIKALYSAYEKEIGIEDRRINYCMVPETGSEICELKQFIQDYTQGDLRQYLMEAHDDWEALINYRKERVVISDGYTDLLYQERLCTDASNIESLNVELMVFGKDLYDSGFTAMDKGVKKGKVYKTSLTESNSITALNELGLYHDMNFFDDDFAPNVSDTISALFSGDMVVENSQYLGQNLSTDDIVNKLKSGDIGTSSNAEVKDTGEDTSELENWQSMTISLTGKDERDLYYILYKIKDCKHDMNKVPSFEDIEDELIVAAEAMEAQKDIAAIITAEYEDLDISDTESLKAYFPDFAVDEKIAASSGEYTGEYASTDEDIDELMERVESSKESSGTDDTEE